MQLWKLDNTCRHRVVAGCFWSDDDSTQICLSIWPQSILELPNNRHGLASRRAFVFYWAEELIRHATVGVIASSPNKQQNMASISSMMNVSLAGNAIYVSIVLRLPMKGRRVDGVIFIHRVFGELSFLLA